MSDGPGIDGLDVEGLYARLSAALGSPGNWGTDRARDGLFGETLWLTWGRRRFVVRRPADAPVAPPGDRRREYRLADALRRTDVPVPRTVHAVEGLARPTFVYDRADGDVLRAGEPAAFATTDHRRRLDAALVDALATVHGLDPDGVGLDDVPGPTPTERAERLRRRLAALLDACPGDPPTAAERVGDWLTATAPAPPDAERRRLVHGEFGLDNVALARSPPPTVAAVLDWERARLGDPRADLARLVARRRLAGADVDLPPALVPAFPAREGYRDAPGLVDLYADRTGRRPTSLRYHRVLALYELAVDCAWLGRRIGGRSGYRRDVARDADAAVGPLLDRAERVAEGDDRP